jgi:ArsR family metal-binding transcriptional regulator
LLESRSVVRVLETSNPGYLIVQSVVSSATKLLITEFKIKKCVFIHKDSIKDLKTLITKSITI